MRFLSDPLFYSHFFLLSPLAPSSGLAFTKIYGC